MRLHDWRDFDRKYRPGIHRFRYLFYFAIPKFYRQWDTKYTFMLVPVLRTDKLKYNQCKIQQIYNWFTCWIVHEVLPCEIVRCMLTCLCVCVCARVRALLLLYFSFVVATHQLQNVTVPLARKDINEHKLLPDFTFRKHNTSIETYESLITTCKIQN